MSHDERDGLPPSGSDSSSPPIHWCESIGLKLTNEQRRVLAECIELAEAERRSRPETPSE